MIHKELKKMGRRELVDIIYQLKKNEQKLQEELALMQEALQEKRIRFSEVGSIAEAATSITDLFSTAQKTADMYLLEISCMKRETEEACAAKIEETDKALAKRISDGENQLAQLRKNYELEYERFRQLQTEVRKLEERYGKWNDDTGKSRGWFRLFK